MPRFTTRAELETFLEANAESMGDDFLKSAADGVETRLERRAGLRRSIRQTWADGFVYLDAVAFVMANQGVCLLDRLQDIEAAGGDEHQSVRTTLALLHANGAVIVQEIRSLLESGFWSAGAARWRALHETAVSAKIIAMSGPQISGRYADHGFVVQTRRLMAYYEAHGTAGPVGEDELRSRMLRAKELEQVHALDDADYRFRDSYGWALPLMPHSKKGKRIPPTMDALERLADLDHRRLLVASSHGLVHSDAAGVHTNVLLDDAWLLGPTEQFVETVARPTFDTVVHLIAATHLCFEPEVNDTLALLGLGAVGTMSLCRRGMDAFASGRKV